MYYIKRLRNWYRGFDSPGNLRLCHAALTVRVQQSGLGTWGRASGLCPWARVIWEAEVGTAKLGTLPG